MSEGGGEVVILPVLVAFAAVAGVENHLRAGIVQTRLVSPDLSSLAQHPVLVAALAVTRPQTNSLVKILSLGCTVNTLVRPGVTDVSTGHGLPGDEELGVDGVEIPLETLTLKQRTDSKIIISTAPLT